MTIQPLRDDQQTLPPPQGSAIGFVDSETQCDDVVHALNEAGVPDSHITVLKGTDGISLFHRMMRTASWGEEVEKTYEQGVMEMDHGHYAMIVETKDRDEAITIADVAQKHGGHGFAHFGLLIDTKLQA